MADGYWEDVGTLEAYLKSHQDILDERVQVAVNGFQLRPGVWLGKGAEIDPSVELGGPGASSATTAWSGRARGSGEYCTLGRNVRIGDNAALQRSVVHDNTYLGAGGPDRRQRPRPRVATSARGSGARRAWCSATSASSVPTPSSRRG